MDYLQFYRGFPATGEFLGNSFISKSWCSCKELRKQSGSTQKIMGINKLMTNHITIKIMVTVEKNQIKFTIKVMKIFFESLISIPIIICH